MLCSDVIQSNIIHMVLERGLMQFPQRNHLGMNKRKFNNFIYIILLYYIFCSVLFCAARTVGIFFSCELCDGVPGWNEIAAKNKTREKLFFILLKCINIYVSSFALIIINYSFAHFIIPFCYVFLKIFTKFVIVKTDHIH